MIEARELKSKEEDREKYIKGIEKQMRQLEEESLRVKNDSSKQDRDTLGRIKELERDMVHLSEQNDVLARSL